METKKTNAGKGLGITALVIGIITVIWSIIPVLGATAFWLSGIGLLLGLIGLISAVRKANPKKGVIITGFILCLISTCVSGYWINTISKAEEALKEMNASDFK